MERKNQRQNTGATPRMVVVAALGVLAFVPSWAVSWEGADAMGPIVDLRVAPQSHQVGCVPFSVPADEDLHFCNSGVDMPRTGAIGSVELGVLILTRSRAAAEPTSKIFSLADNRVLLDSADLSLGTSSGLDVTFLMPLGESLGVETRYFGITGWRASRVVTDPLDGGVRFEGFGTSLAAETERIDYASRLYNIELNMLPLVTAGVPVVLGFRSLQLHERFELWQLDTLPASARLGSYTNNYLYGFQVGAEPYLSGAGGALRVDGLIKAGIYGNHAAQGVFSPLLGTSVEARRNRPAFVGELGIDVVYRFSRFFSLRGGYELLWLSSVALAPDQSRSTDLAAPSAGLNLGAAFFHGATASVEFVF
jgi:hypothetical protein